MSTPVTDLFYTFIPRFWLFARVGAPLPLINVLMYWAYLEWMYQA